MILSVSRTSFKWGIQVPNNDKHIVYVWLRCFDKLYQCTKFSKY